MVEEPLVLRKPCQCPYYDNQDKNTTSPPTFAPDQVVYAAAQYRNSKVWPGFGEDPASVWTHCGICKNPDKP